MQPSLSPDAQLLAVTIREGSNYEIWISEVSRGTLTRLTFHPEEDINPIWTPDGKQVTFSSEMAGEFPTLWWRAADGSGAAEQLLVGEEGLARFPNSWSPDNQTLAFTENGTDTGSDVWLLPDEGKGEPRPFLRTEFEESWGMISPDGQWIAYVSNETGQNEIYVQAFPESGGKLQISVGGGAEAVWRRDGRELLYRNGDKMMAVAIEREPKFSAGLPRLLFEGRFVGTGPVHAQRNYDISPDGQRFLMIKREEDLMPTELTVVFNWFEELKRLVPTP